MLVISETLVAPHPPEDVFSFVADFGRIAQWDPNVVSSKLRGSKPLEVGATSDLRVQFGPRVLPMTYTLLTWEPGARAGWRGENSSSVSVDDIQA